MRPLPGMVCLACGSTGEITSVIPHKDSTYRALCARCCGDLRVRDLQAQYRWKSTQDARGVRRDRFLWVAAMAVWGVVGFWLGRHF